MRRFTTLALVLALAVGLTACASTSLKTTWSAPDAKPLDFAGKKVLATVIVGNDGVRRPAEDFLAKELTTRGAQGVPAYSVLTSEQNKDQEAVQAKLTADGFAGAVVLRVVNVSKEVSSDMTAGAWATPYYGSFYGYYGAGWGGVYAAPSIRTDTIVSIETTVFSLAQNKMVWAGMSETFNPSDLEKTVHEITQLAAHSMEKAGLIRAAK